MTVLEQILILLLLVLLIIAAAQRTHIKALGKLLDLARADLAAVAEDRRALLANEAAWIAQQARQMQEATYRLPQVNTPKEN